MAALLDDLAAVDHDDPIGAACGREPVRDEQRGATAGDQAHRPLHPGLGTEVEVGGGLVEQQDRRVDEQRAREADELALPGRQRASALRDRLQVAAGELGDELVRADFTRRLLDLGVARVGSAVRDVVADGSREEERLLGHVPEPAAVRAQVELGDRRAVDQDLPAGDVVEARDELDDRRLPGAGLADQRNRLAGLDREVDAVHDLDAGVRVAEVHVVELDLTRDTTGLDGVLRVGRGHLGVHELVDLRHRRERRLPLVEHLRELLDRCEELVEEQDEREHGGAGDDAVVHQRSAVSEHDRVRARGQEHDQREVERLDPLGRDPGVPVHVGGVAERVDVLVFAHVRLRDRGHRRCSPGTRR